MSISQTPEGAVQPQGEVLTATGQGDISVQKRPRQGIMQLVRRAVVALLMSSTLIGMGLVASPAEATTVRPGRGFGQIDVLLDSYETEAARRDYWAATVICWNSGIGGKVLSIGVCQVMVTVCAAQAYYATPRKRAGMTVTIQGGYWCWKY